MKKWEIVENRSGRAGFTIFPPLVERGGGEVGLELADEFLLGIECAGEQQGARHRKNNIRIRIYHTAVLALHRDDRAAGLGADRAVG